MNNELRKQIGNILSEVLNTALPPGDNPKREEMPSWDSLKHMELILRLEEQFNVRFSIREVAGIKSLHDLVEIIEVKS
ncbi:acyl carrier protein [Paenibacillus sp. DMB20]|uniref:acyl carrier protein n=1 Tax=Paenibacillus sp. DMB20 TaxID=1642570 RepID=UPI000627788B|nr:acyl carrier protein [Paenibacillus sp. DMB20]KKO54269.1 acyl carrier protein [Paenibacillus sp. DMB20]